jgi:hypothetical protein
VLATLINTVSLAGLEKRERNYADANCPGDEDKKRPSQENNVRLSNVGFGYVRVSIRPHFPHGNDR